MVLRVIVSVCLIFQARAETSEDNEMAGLLQSTVTSDGKMLEVLSGGSQRGGEPANLIEMIKPNAHARKGVVVVRDHLPGAKGKDPYLCLVPGALVPIAGTPISQGSCTDSRAQWTKLFHAGTPGDIIHEETGLCLDVKGESCSHDAQLILWPCSKGGNQDWWFANKAGGFTFKPVHCGTNMCVDMVEGSGKRSGKMVLWTCKASLNQRFHFKHGSKNDLQGGEPAKLIEMINPEKTHQGLVVFRGHLPGTKGKDQTCLVPLGQTAGSHVAAGACDGSNAQWTKVFHAGTAGDIIHTDSGLCLDVEKESCNHDAQLILWPCSKGGNQDFLFGNKLGGFTFKPVHCKTNMCVDIVKGSNNVVLWTCKASLNQQFHFKHGSKNDGEPAKLIEMINSNGDSLP